MSERCADQGAIGHHLGHATAEVVAMFGTIMGEPRGYDFLQTGQGARSEHFRSEWVGLELLQVGL